jgi:hypothetical protein
MGHRVLYRFVSKILSILSFYFVEVKGQSALDTHRIDV